MYSEGDMWVFGYGSLMWQPGFAFVERTLAALPGWQRRFCLRSIRYRGTPEAPGLVLGLDADPAATCQGVAFRVAAANAEEVHAYLRARELVTYAYRETHQPALLRDGRTVSALTYVVDRTHPQYAGDLLPEAQAAIIARATGPSGTNRAYLDNTLAHLRDVGIADPGLAHIGSLVAACG